MFNFLFPLSWIGFVHHFFANPYVAPTWLRAQVIRLHLNIAIGQRIDLLLFLRS